MATQRQWFVVLSDQGRTDDVDSFLTKKEAMTEVRYLEKDCEENPRFYYHLANPSWFVEPREVVMDEHHAHASH